MKKVADWQLAHQKEVKHHPMDWTNATLYIGMVKWAELADKVDKDETYYKWLVDTERFRIVVFPTPLMPERIFTSGRKSHCILKRPQSPLISIRRI